MRAICGPRCAYISPQNGAFPGSFQSDSHETPAAVSAPTSLRVLTGGLVSIGDAVELRSSF